MKKTIRKIAYKLGVIDFVNKHNEKKMLTIKSNLLKTYGTKMLDMIHEVADELNKPIWLEFGTLLGAYRDKSFISYDYDLDVGMYIEDYDINFENALIMKGFVKEHFFYQYSSDGTRILTEVTWKYNNFNIDIFLSVPIDEKRIIYCYGKKDEKSFAEGKWEVMSYYHPNALPLENVYINGIKYYAPANPVQCLKDCYGDTFMTPIKNCSANDYNPLVKIWDIDERYARLTRVDNE